MTIEQAKSLIEKAKLCRVWAEHGRDGQPLRLCLSTCRLGLVAMSRVACAEIDLLSEVVWSSTEVAAERQWQAINAEVGRLLSDWPEEVVP